jgi:hypothetical protein
VTCTLGARQWPRYKELWDSRCWLTISETSLFSVVSAKQQSNQQQQSVLRSYKQE